MAQVNKKCYDGRTILESEFHQQKTNNNNPKNDRNPRSAFVFCLSKMQLSALKLANISQSNYQLADLNRTTNLAKNVLNEVEYF